ncbi:hypothetical protein K493DRAFT_411146 [Basidiobolus meristosporus CBS 931.73]|uniref:Uncharacterized protein n=1 Tax=Basidiobolus meristosporus CBS 931.73 TaxID=1314790 RepID=A0A1Y1XPQ0_9FUNG|nr:hypothetical protein K493DRAFT_411146 [Basidiobolus meristosporus CBS 931.73]|eukprot:ORX87723.1 hypothetical protein K493DRAFT_411146 [Basidiobolus meristosporus CBS 931.73]
MRKRTSISPRDLDRLKRSELQALCRKHNIKGLTRKNAELVADLRAAFLEKQKEEISDVELSDSDIPVDEAEDSVDQDRSDLLDELTFAPSTFTKKVLSNISYTKEVPSTRAKSDTQRLGKAKKVSEYTKRVKSEEESEDDTSMGIGKTGITQDTDMNDSFVFTFDSSAAKKSSITSKLAVEQQTKKSSLTNDFTKSSKSSVKSGEASHSRAKEPIRVPSSNDIETKTRLSHEPAEQTLGADQAIRNQSAQGESRREISGLKEDEPRVSPELQPVPTKKRQREPENSKEATVSLIKLRSKL